MAGAATSQWTVTVPAKAPGAARLSLFNPEPRTSVEEGARELKLVLYDWSITKAEEFIGKP